MNFFNFELTEDSYSKKKIILPEKLTEKLPKDYLDFLEHYNSVMSKKGNGIYVKIDNYEMSVGLYGYDEIKNLNSDSFPECFFYIAEDYEFEGFIMSLRKKDFGHIYYIDLETWQFHVLELEDENMKIKNIDKYCIHIANSFTEFTHKLYAPDKDGSDNDVF